MFNIKFSKLPFSPATAVRQDDEEVVKNGLSITPAEALDLTMKGMPITSLNGLQNEKLVDEPDKGYFVPIESRRGFDALADGYQLQMEQRSRLREVIHKQVEKVKNAVTAQTEEGGPDGTL